MHWRTVTAIAVVLAGLPFSSARSLEAHKPGPDWQQARADNEIAIYFRDDPKAKARELNAITEMNAPPEAVFRVITDFENYPKFMPFTKEEKILRRPADNMVVIYSLLAPPMTAWRDGVSQITMTKGTPENKGVFRSEWLAMPDGAPLRKGVIRIQINKGSWLLEPIDGGKRTRVTYTILTNPGGNIPRFILDQSNNVGMPDLFKAVRKRATGHE